MERWRGIHKLIEECGEVLQVCGKLGAFPDGEHPSGDLIARQLIDELTDLHAAMFYFMEENGLTFDPERFKDKLQKYDNWILSGVEDGKPND